MQKRLWWDGAEWETGAIDSRNRYEGGRGFVKEGGGRGAQNVECRRSPVKINRIQDLTCHKPVKMVYYWITR